MLKAFFNLIRIKFVERNSHRKKQRSVRWQLRFSLNDLSSHKLWLEENSLSRIAEKRKRQTRQKPFPLLHLTRARSHLPESDNPNVCYVVSHNSFVNLFVELRPSRNSPSYNWREE